MNLKNVDLVVIGSGPGGYAAAFRASDLGQKVLLIEKDLVLGGVCLNRGCIPSKALLHISKVINDADHLSECGVKFEKPKINIDAMREYKDKIVSRLNSGISQMAKLRKVETLQGEASFVSDTELVVKLKDQETKVSFINCIIASGSSSSLIPGLPKNNPNILTSKTALELDSIPPTLLVVGGGIIGLELGQVYASLGSKVTIVEYLPSLVPGADPDIIKPLQRKLNKQFERILLSSKVVNVSETKQGQLSVQTEDKNGIKEQTFDKILISVGRTPNIDSLNLQNTNIDLDEAGFIKVNEYQKTTAGSIYAIGDIVGNPMLAHKATYQGKIAAEVISGHPAVYDVKTVPSVVYTDPEVAWAGLTEKEAKENEIPYEKGEFPWAASGKALILNANQGKTKILFNPENKQVIGVGIVGPSAGDIISEAMLAIEMGSDAEDIGLTMHPHPTLGETMAAAAEVFTGSITDLYFPSKK
jgi:dihydrolipoamide dehydrogenase